MGQTALDRRGEYTGEDSVPQGSGATDWRCSVVVAGGVIPAVGVPDAGRAPISEAAPDFYSVGLASSW